MKKIYYSWQINVPSINGAPAYSVSNAASANGVYRSYQEAEDYLRIVRQDYPLDATTQIFQVHETKHTIKSIEVVRDGQLV